MTNQPFCRQILQRADAQKVAQYLLEEEKAADSAGDSGGESGVPPQK